MKRLSGLFFALALTLVAAAEATNLEAPPNGIWKLRTGAGDGYRHPPEAQPRFPTYFPNTAWARFMVARWAPAIRELGFDGIHWDTLCRRFRLWERMAGITGIDPRKRKSMCTGRRSRGRG